MSAKIPHHVKLLLWDVPESNISLKDHSTFIIERVLEYGDIEDIIWAKKNYDLREIQHVLLESKRISPKTGHFFSVIFNIPEEQFYCIRNPFSQKQQRF